MKLRKRKHAITAKPIQSPLEKFGLFFGGLKWNRRQIKEIAAADKPPLVINMIRSL